MTAFDLTFQPWLPVTRLDGSHAELSLQEVFVQAHDLRDLGAASPLTQAALYRLLLAILHRACLGPADFKAWRSLWRAGRFGEGITEYLHRHADRFDLFSPSHPFYQTPGLTTDSAPAPVSKLFHELACANNKTLFDHSLDHAPPALTPAGAARALVSFQGYALGGGKSASSRPFGAHPYFGHAPLIQGAVVFIQGDNLFQTLLLNAVSYDPTQPRPIPRDFAQEDLPVWERNALRRPPRDYPQAGYLEYLTWTSRHIRLIPNEAGGGVTHFYLAQGESLAAAVDDPFFALRVSKAGDRFPIKLQEGRALWRDSGTLFNFAHFDDATPKHDRCPANIAAAHFRANQGEALPELRCTVIGLANNKANPLLWRMEQLPLRHEVLSDYHVVDRIQQALVWVEHVGYVLREATYTLAGEILTAGKRNPDAKDKARFAADLGTEALYWAGLEPLFRRYLDELPQAADREARQRAWQEASISLARQTLHETTENALGYSARELRARVLAWGRFDVYAAHKLKNRDNQEETPA